MPGTYIELIWKSRAVGETPARYRKACAYRAYIPELLSGMHLSFDASTAGAISEAENSIHALNAEAHPALAPLARLLLRTESIASSKVEGLQVGVRALARAESRAESRAKSSHTALEVLANIDAMAVAVDDASIVASFTVKEIIAIHRRLLESGRQRIAGQIRATQNWIGGNDYNPCGADFVPPPPEMIASLLEDLCDAINRDELPPIVQAALVHAQFETIHPFADGNGRTGRALIHVVLRRRGIAPAYVPPISVILANSRDSYIAGLTDFRRTGVSSWIRHFAESTTQAAMLARAYLEAVRSLTTQWRAQLTSAVAPRADAAAWALIDILPAHPIITASVAANTTDRAMAAIYQGIDELQRAGVLVPMSQSRRNQSWEARGLFDLLEQLDAGDFPRK